MRGEWSRSQIRKSLINSGFSVHEITIPSKGHPRGVDGNVFSASVSRDGVCKEMTLGYKSVKQCIEFIESGKWRKKFKCNKLA